MKGKLCATFVLVMVLSAGFSLSAWGSTFTLRNGMSQQDGSVGNAMVQHNGQPSHELGDIPPGQAVSFREDDADWRGRRSPWDNLEVWTKWPASYGCPSGHQIYRINTLGDITIVIKKDGCNYTFTRE